MESKDKDIVLYTPKTPQQSYGQIMLAIADKMGKYKLALYMLKQGHITLADFLMYERERKI